MVVGEAGGLQDALWGFGIRMALLSGYLAATAFIDGSTESYERLSKERLYGSFRTSVVNRYFYEKLGDHGYRLLSYRLASARSPRNWLRKHYASSPWKSLLFPFVRGAVLAREATAPAPIELSAADVRANEM